MSEVDDLAFVIDDGTLSEAWTISRMHGSFQQGGWVVDSTTSLPGWGVVSVATDEDQDMMNIGDRITGAMVFHSQSRIFETQVDANGTEHMADILIWNFQKYRVMHVAPYPNRNYWKAIAVRMQGN